jgi:hypothetical protein
MSCCCVRIYMTHMARELGQDAQTCVPMTDSIRKEAEGSPVSCRCLDGGKRLPDPKHLGDFSPVRGLRGVLWM